MQSRKEDLKKRSIELITLAKQGKAQELFNYIDVYHLNINDPDLTYLNGSLLHDIVDNKEATKILKPFLEHYRDIVDINIRNKFGSTPLMVAISAKNFEAIEILLQCDAKTDFKNNNGKTARDYVKEYYNDYKLRYDYLVNKREQEEKLLLQSQQQIISLEIELNEKPKELKNLLQSQEIKSNINQDGINTESLKNSKSHKFQFWKPSVIFKIKGHGKDENKNILPEQLSSKSKIL